MNKSTFTMGATLLLAIISIITTDLYLPSLPAITEIMHTTPHMGKLTIGVFVLGLSISPLLLGTLADRYGRRRMLLISSAIGLVGTLIAASSFTIWMLLFARLVQGFGFGGCLSLARTIVNDLYQGEKLAQMAGLLGLVVACGPAVAPVIGSHMAAHFGWRSVFILVFVMVAIVWVLLANYMQETAKILHTEPSLVKKVNDSINELFRSKKFLSHALVSGLGVSSVFLFATVSPFILQNGYHLTPIQFGWAMAAVTSVVLISRFGNMVLIKKMTTEKIIMLCCSVMLFASILFCVMTLVSKSYIWAFLFPIMTIIFGASIIPMNALVGALSPFKHIGGAAGAIYGCMQMLVTFLVTFTGGVFVSNAKELSVVYLLIAMIAFVAYSIFGYPVQEKMMIEQGAS